MKTYRQYADASLIMLGRAQAYRRDGKHTKAWYAIKASLRLNGLAIKSTP